MATLRGTETPRIESSCFTNGSGTKDRSGVSAKRNPCASSSFALNMATGRTLCERYRPDNPHASDLLDRAQTPAPKRCGGQLWENLFQKAFSYVPVRAEIPLATKTSVEPDRPPFREIHLEISEPSQLPHQPMANPYGRARSALSGNK